MRSSPPLYLGSVHTAASTLFVLAGKLRVGALPLALAWEALGTVGSLGIHNFIEENGAENPLPRHRSRALRPPPGPGGRAGSGSMQGRAPAAAVGGVGRASRGGRPQFSTAQNRASPPRFYLRARAGDGDASAKLKPYQPPLSGLSLNPQPSKSASINPQPSESARLNHQHPH